MQTSTVNHCCQQGAFKACYSLVAYLEIERKWMQEKCKFTRYLVVVLENLTLVKLCRLF